MFYSFSGALSDKSKIAYLDSCMPLRNKSDCCNRQYHFLHAAWATHPVGIFLGNGHYGLKRQVSGRLSRKLAKKSFRFGSVIQWIPDSGSQLNYPRLVWKIVVDTLPLGSILLVKTSSHPTKLPQHYRRTNGSTSNNLTNARHAVVSTIHEDEPSEYPSKFWVWLKAR